MAHIVLTCWGSHGDVDPFVGLGLALRARGHQVTVATLEYYRELIERAELRFRPVRPAVDPDDTALLARIMDPMRGSAFILGDLLFPAIAESFADVSAAAEGADLLISHPVTFATPIVAAHRRMPWASVVLAPASMFSVYDYPAIPPAPWVKSLQRFGTWPGRLIVAGARRETARWAAPAFALRESLGLARGANPVLEGQHSPHLVLALYPGCLGAPQPDWPAHTVVTGAVVHDAAHGTALGADVQAFLDAGPAPLVFTLGSSVVRIAQEFWQESLDALRVLRVRAVLLAGAAAPDLRRLIAQDPLLRDSVWAVERAPHSLLFSKASVVIQQCGVGTLAQGLASGRPLLSVPYAHDQPDNAWRARALGLSRTLYPKQYRSARIVSELRTLLDDPQYAAAAARIAPIVRAERGAAAACEAIERTFTLATT